MEEVKWSLRLWWCNASVDELVMTEFSDDNNKDKWDNYISDNDNGSMMMVVIIYFLKLNQIHKMIFLDFDMNEK